MKKWLLTAICFVLIGIVYALDVMNNVFNGTVMESFMYAYPQLSFSIWIGLTIVVCLIEGKRRV